DHEPLSVGPSRAYWLRCRMVAPEPDQPGYRESPKISSLEVVGLGGWMGARNAEPVAQETLGTSDGTPGQRFRVRDTPVLPRSAEETVVVATAGGAAPWVEVGDFSASGPEDPHYTWDGTTGEISFGPLVRYG